MLLLGLLAACRYSNAYTLNFKECPPLTAESEFLGSHAALRVGDTVEFDYDFCAMHEIGLRHARSVAITVQDGTNQATVLHQSVTICEGNGSDCRKQLRTASHPSCIYGTKTIASFPSLTASAATTISLLLQEADGSTIAKFCGSYIP